MKRIIALCAAFALAGLDLAAVTIDNLQLHIFVKTLDHPVPPLVRDGYLILSLGGAHRFVGAAFEHEGFAVVHPFEVNERGVFVLAWPIPVDFTPRLAYRLDIDGAWIADPGNPGGSSRDADGLAVSLVDLPRIPGDVPGLYRVLAADGRTARFLFKAPPGESVSVAGSFNNWDPFTHELEETSPGVYQLSLRLPPGITLYCFVWRGKFLPDPLNDDKASDRYDRVVSVLRVGSKAEPGDPTIAALSFGK
ncbi:MAG TPA: hypothetical protein VMV44_10240 [Rectinemataceae bacterium]|nr:hypothetical protein [Rectinemataceae bacterium]